MSRRTATAADALREGEERLRLAAQAARFGTYDRDFTTGRTVWSREVKEIAGLPPDDTPVSPERIEELIHPDDLGRVREKTRESFEPSRAGEFEDEHRILRPDGSARWVLVKGRTFFAGEGAQRHPVRAMGVVLDITDRKRAEQALRESEERFRILADSSPVLIWVDGPDGCEFVNHTYRRFLGVSAGDVRGHAWKRFIHPEDREAYEDAYSRATEQRVGLDVEFRFRRHDGEYRWMRSVGHPRYGPDGEFLGYGGCIFDVTERKQAAEELRVRARQQQAVAKLGELALRVGDLQRLFDHATAAVAETLGVEYCKVLELLPDGEKLLLRAGVGWREGLVGRATVGADIESQAGYTLLSDAPVIVTSMREEERFSGPALLLDHAVVSGMSCIVRRTDGTPWGVLGTHSTRRITFTEDDVSFLMAVANILGDAIHRERAERALKEADRRKDEFLATLAHELRNPLSAVRNAIATASLDETRRPRALEIARRQADQLGRLIDDLLDVARITHGRITLGRERMRLAEVVQHAVESTRAAIESRGLHVAVSLPPEPIGVEADGPRLEQVFVNLLSNASKYTEAGGRIHVVVEAHDGAAVIRIRDTGIGIAPEMLPRVWDLFAQADRTLDRAQGGLGIGLTVARRLVELHDGRITASSEGLGKGAEFTVTLPSLPLPSEAAPGLMPAAPVSRPAALMLLVEDNLDAAESLVMLLELLGHRVHVTHDGMAGLDAVRAHVPDVMLVDIGLPGMDGYEVARRVRRDPNLDRVVLVALTGYGREEDKQQARAAGFDHHLVKPVTPDSLHGLVAGLVKPEPEQPSMVH